MSARFPAADIAIEEKRSVQSYFEEIKSQPGSSDRLTLREAVNILKSHVPDALNSMNRDSLDLMVADIYGIATRTHARLREQVLSVEDVAILRMFTAEEPTIEPQFYTLVNHHLRDRRALPAMVPYVWRLMNVLKKCPVFEGTHVYRGIHLEGDALMELLSRYTIGPRHKWHCFASTSAIVSVPQRFLGETTLRDARGHEYRVKKGVLFMIHLRPGARAIKRFSDFYGEEEVLLPPNFTFEVIDRYSPNEGFYILQLRELENDDSILNLDTSEETACNVQRLRNELAAQAQRYQELEHRSNARAQEQTAALNAANARVQEQTTALNAANASLNAANTRVQEQTTALNAANTRVQEQTAALNAAHARVEELEHACNVAEPRRSDDYRTVFGGNGISRPSEIINGRPGSKPPPPFPER